MRAGTVALLLAVPGSDVVSELAGKNIASDARRDCVGRSAAKFTQRSMRNWSKASEGADRLVNGKRPRSPDAGLPGDGRWSAEIAGFAVFRIPL
jgi:hypothetical protein